MWVGVVLIVVGFIFLLQSLGFVTGDVWNFVWPAIIVMLGVFIIINKRKEDDKCCKEDEAKKSEKK